MSLRLEYISILSKNKCPAVAQPGRAFGCSCWQNIANRTSAYQAYISAVTEESQAQSRNKRLFFGVNPARGIQTDNKLVH